MENKIKPHFEEIGLDKLKEEYQLKVNKMIDDYVKGMKEIDENFQGIDKIMTHEKEQENYIVQFGKFGIKPNITSALYGVRENAKLVQKIKDNIGRYLIH